MHGQYIQYDTRSTSAWTVHAGQDMQDMQDMQDRTCKLDRQDVRPARR